MKRTPLKRTGTLKRTKLRAKSVKRAREDRARRRALEAEFGPRSSWRCILRNDEIAKMALGDCGGPVNGHELVKSVHGGSRVDVENIVLVCNRHNDSIEEHPVEARKLGLVRSFWEDT
jgi:hypothetical protein